MEEVYRQRAEEAKVQKTKDPTSITEQAFYGRPKMAGGAIIDPRLLSASACEGTGGYPTTCGPWATSSEMQVVAWPREIVVLPAVEFDEVPAAPHQTKKATPR